jgi:hypothetical protein
MMPVERKEEKQSSSLISFLPQDDWKKAALAMGVSALLGVAALYLGSNRKPARQVITLDFDPRAMMPNYASVDENPADHALNLNSSAVRELFSAYPNSRQMFKVFYLKRAEIFNSALKGRGNFALISQKLPELLIYTFQDLGEQYFAENESRKVAMNELFVLASEFAQNDPDVVRLMRTEQEVLKRIQPFTSPVAIPDVSRLFGS